MVLREAELLRRFVEVRMGWDGGDGVEGSRIAVAGLVVFEVGARAHRHSRGLEEVSRDCLWVFHL